MVEGGWHHVYDRIPSGEPVFAGANEAIEFVDIIRDVNRRHGWTGAL